MSKPFVYVASPYTKGDPCVNANFQARIFDDMLNDGIVIPYIPLWSHFQHSVAPRPYTDWIAYDNCIMPRVDALIRLNAEFVWPDGTKYECCESSGADNEVKLAASLGKPTFTTIEDLYAWAKALVPSPEPKLIFDESGRHVQTHILKHDGSVVKVIDHT